MSTNVHDVLVIGGGPAGSSCARALTRAGLDVCVLDRAAFPRDKICAGWITPAVVDALALDLDDYAHANVLQPITGFLVGMLGGRTARCDYGRVVSYAIRRCEFDDYLLRRSGARLRLGEPVEAIEREAGGWRVNGDLRARLLVGAGGHACPVARLLGDTRGTERPIAAQEVEFRLTGPSQAEGTHPLLLFCGDLLGYGWCVRKGEHVNVGLGRLVGAHLADDVRALQRELAERGYVAETLPAKARGHAYLSSAASHRTRVADGAVLVGDAAGLADPRSGEGIRPAVESGLLAAQAIVAANGDARAARFASYAAAMREHYGAPAAQDGIPPPSALRSSAMRWLLGWPAFVRRFVLDGAFLHEGTPLHLAQ